MGPAAAGSNGAMDAVGLMSRSAQSVDRWGIHGLAGGASQTAMQKAHDSKQMEDRTACAPRGCGPSAHTNETSGGLQGQLEVPSFGANT